MVYLSSVHAIFLRVGLYVLLAVLAVLAGIAPAYAQEQPTSLSLQPPSIYQGQCYTMTAGNGSDMTLDVQYRLNGGSVQTISNWPSLDGAGQAEICTGSATATGQYRFVGIRNADDTEWLEVDEPITVNPPPSQPSFLLIEPPAVTAGGEYTMTADGGENMTLDVQYRLNGGQLQTITGWPNLDSYGQAKITTGPATDLGTYTFSKIRNTLLTAWVAVNASVTVNPPPPQPTSLSVSPPSVPSGETYTMTVGNGGNMTLDVQYSLNGGTTQTITAWPTLTNGQRGITTGSCTAPGNYVYTAIRNTLNTSWVFVNASVTVGSAAAPQVSTVSPSGGMRGSNVGVTITGYRLCGAGLTTNSQGLTISNVVASETTVTATFNISASATMGTATVTLAAHGSQTTFDFLVASSSPPTVQSINPSSLAKGSSALITVNGSNLTGATWSTSWSGVSFSNFTSSSDGTTATANMTVSGSAAAGNPAIQITTLAGSVATPQFTILPAVSILSREYIYLGGRLVAVKPPQ